MTNFSGENLNAGCGGPQGGGVDSRRNGVAEISPKYLTEAASNAVPVGYKQTEVGVIPEDWVVATIAEKHTLATGSTPPTSNLKNYGETYLFVSPADLSDKKYILKTEKKLSEQGFKISRKYPAGSTLFTCIGSTIGKTGLAPVELTSNQQINAIFPNEDGDAEFTYYAVTYIAPKVKALAGQQAVPLVNKTEFGETLFCFPRTKQEQTAIANALSDVDALISELEKLIAKKQAIKTATMQQLLTGRTRLPQFALREDGTPTNSSGTNLDAGTGGPKGEGQDGLRKGTKPSELGEIPEDWEIFSLGQSIAKTQLGGNYKNSEHDTGQPLIKMGNLGRGFVKLSKQEFIIGNASESDLLNYGDVLFNTRNTLELVGKVAIWKNELPKAYFNSNLMRISFKEDLVSSNLFMNALMNSERFIKALSDIAIGTTSVAAIYNRDLFLIKVALPTKKEQTAIATILSDMDAEIQALEQRLGKTRQIKQGMMQELLTGKTRLIKGEAHG